MKSNMMKRIDGQIISKQEHQENLYSWIFGLGTGFIIIAVFANHLKSFF